LKFFLLQATVYADYNICLTKQILIVCRCFGKSFVLLMMGRCFVWRKSSERKFYCSFLLFDSDKWSCWKNTASIFCSWHPKYASIFRDKK